MAIVSRTYLVNGTFTVPAGVTSVELEGCGGGGGGGGGGGAAGGLTAGVGGGGGGGSQVCRVRVAVVPGAVYSITVGPGGTLGLGKAGSGLAGVGGDGGSTAFQNSSGDPSFLQVLFPGAGGGGAGYDAPFAQSEIVPGGAPHLRFPRQSLPTNPAVVTGYLYRAGEGGCGTSQAASGIDSGIRGGMPTYVGSAESGSVGGAPGISGARGGGGGGGGASLGGGGFGGEGDSEDLNGHSGFDGHFPGGGGGGGGGAGGAATVGGGTIGGNGGNGAAGYLKVTWEA